MIINFSGHPTNINGVTYQAKIGMLDFTDPSILISQLQEVLMNLEEFEQLKSGATATIILPSMSTAVAPFLAMWHGLFGSFPVIRWAIRTEKGFEFLDSCEIDLQELRNVVRKERF